MPTAVLEKYNTLTDELKSEVNDFIDFLLKNQKKNEAISTLKNIQNLFSNDKGWNSEEEMIKDMANFRKSRMGL